MENSLFQLQQYLHFCTFTNLTSKDSVFQSKYCHRIICASAYIQSQLSGQISLVLPEYHLAFQDIQHANAPINSVGEEKGYLNIHNNTPPDIVLTVQTGTPQNLGYNFLDKEIADIFFTVTGLGMYNF